MKDSDTYHYNANYFVPFNITRSSDDKKQSPKMRSDLDVKSLIDNLPIPPRGYSFSKQQRDQQFEFFKNFHDQLPLSKDLDMYRADVIFVCKYI